MELTLQTPALLFPTISLLILAYTNRYLHLGTLIRNLHAQHKEKPDPLIIAQLGNLRFRINLIKNMQFMGVSSLFCCVLCMLVLFTGHETIGQWIFLLSLALMMGSLSFSLWEIQLSAVALNLHLSDLESEENSRS
ncbi:Protein of unknown function (DUF2721) [Abditibacterium utsteinense]|uniref:DUF2721 domain-containing protein n=1 Tax=Abditibacterium utsteinense TaxID=1960156 RepID=A0A2S8SWW3_9BACT|nr:DUF2721 domain-containing protein [Abditibacterium utsteinense]PQV65287.1 Protein of unknown function (DUF2721) [Abditibacterium utsteinense]